MAKRAIKPSKKEAQKRLKEMTAAQKGLTQDEEKLLSETLTQYLLEATFDMRIDTLVKTLARRFKVAKSLFEPILHETVEKLDLPIEDGYLVLPNTPVWKALVNKSGEASIEAEEGIKTVLISEFSALPHDVVEVRPVEAYVPACRVTRVIKRYKTKYVCTARANRRSGLAMTATPIGRGMPFSFRLLEPLEVKLGYAFEVEVMGPEAVSGDLDVFMDRYEPLPLFPAKFVRWVGQRNDPLGELEIAASRFDVPIDFSPEALEQAEVLPDEVDEESKVNRVDLRDIPFVTIDGEDARDFDDAVYGVRLEQGGWRLLVAIADVSHYVTEGSALDKDAQTRATSVYFPSTVVPMLPEKLSNGLCSLNPNVDRLTMVCDAVLDEKGVVTAYQFYPAVINSHARLTYTKVWGALSGDKDAQAALGERFADVEVLYELSQARLKRRKERNAIDLAMGETLPELDDKGHILGFHKREQNDAHRLIEECMLVANTCAAQMVLAKKVESLFRVHDKIADDRLIALQQTLMSFGVRLASASAADICKAIEETKSYDFLQSAILRSMSRAMYSPDNIGHFGLQFDAYSHFTSPIRRYPDLLLHRTIKGILVKKTYVPKVLIDVDPLSVGYHAKQLGMKPKALEKESKGSTSAKDKNHQAWESLGGICSMAERRADDATRDVMAYLKCEFMSHFVGKRFKGIVSGIIPAGVFVQIMEPYVEGFVHISNLGWGFYYFDEQNMKLWSEDEMAEFTVGTTVEVELMEVEEETRRINFKVASGAKKTPHKTTRSKKKR